jgi:hypothetical protein
MWRFQLTVGAVLLAGIPVLNVFTTHSHLGVSLFGGPGLLPVAAFDIVVLILGALLGWAAWWLGHKAKQKAAKKQTAADAGSTSTMEPV